MGWCTIDEADLQKLRDKVKSLQKEIEELRRKKYKSIKDKKDCPLYLPPRHICETCLAKKEGNCPLPKFKMKSRTGIDVPISNSTTDKISLNKRLEEENKKRWNDDR